jgi:hypothetical protein
LTLHFSSFLHRFEKPLKVLFYPMSKFFRLTIIRERRVLTSLGWVTLLTAFGSALVLIVLIIHPFLAPIKPVEGDILVVEGWLPDYALGQAKELFQQGDYQLLFTTGGKRLTGPEIPKYETWPELAASTLRKMGIPQEKIIAVPLLLHPRKDRTYYAALALQKQLSEEGFEKASIDVVSLDVHARRSWLVFEKVFPSVNVGIIAIMSKSYEPSQWWSSSAGVRSVIPELIAYLYARLIFNPPSL